MSMDDDASRAGINYRLPKNPGFLGESRWRAKLCGFALFLLCQIAATEYLAWRFHQPDIDLVFRSSRILGWASGVPIYLPLCWVKWIVTHHKWVTQNNPPFTAPMMTAAGIGFAGVLCWLMSGRSNFNQRAKGLEENSDDLYGSSRWANRAALDAMGLTGEPRGLLLGAWRETEGGPLRYLYDESDQHVLVSAPTRTGKTATLGILNALLWAASMLVVDVKEELFKAVAGHRQREGHICVKFAPLDPDNSIRINPLAWIRFGTIREIADVQVFAEGFAHPGNEGQDSAHWNDTSMALIEGVIIHEYYKCLAIEGRMVTLDDISRSLSPFELSFEDYLKEMASFQHDIAGTRKWKNADGTPTKIHPFVREKAMEALQRDVKEASSVLSTAKKRFRIFADPLVREATSGCDFEIEDLVDHEKPVSLFLVIPPNQKKRLAPLVRVILLMSLGRLTEEQRARRHELLMLLDEFPTLGYMEPMEDAPSYIAGYGIRLLIIVQNLSQINSVKRYGPDNELIPNMHIKISYTVSDIKTAKLLSDEFGSQTVRHGAIQYAQTGKNHKGPVQAVGAHVQNTKRALVEPEEFMRLKLPAKQRKKVIAPGDFVMTVFGHMPVRGVQAFWFLDPTFREWVGLPIADQNKALVKRDYVKEAFSA
jgi:type IV secretion system protein VirD4